MKTFSKFLILIIISIVAFLLSCGIGSVFIHPADSATVFFNTLIGRAIPENISDVTVSILLSMRLPRTVLAFICGAGLSVSGVIMQSVLRNPLASSFTLGVSSGAALGASLVIITGVGLFGAFTLPLFGLTSGLLTVFAAVAMAIRLDKSLQNNSIILTGMAFSLFANAMITVVTTFAREDLQRLVFWQMGSFEMRSSDFPFILLPIVFVCFLLAMFNSRRMDIMTLGDEQAMTSGVNAKNVKMFLLGLGAVLTGAIVSFVGVIGFVDLFTPHVARRIFGATHRLVLPASALLGGAFMIFCDVLARTIIAPMILPVGAVTAVFGAPFFLYIYFGRRTKST